MRVCSFVACLKNVRRKCNEPAVDHGKQSVRKGEHQTSQSHTSNVTTASNIATLLPIPTPGRTEAEPDVAPSAPPDGEGSDGNDTLSREVLGADGVKDGGRINVLLEKDEDETEELRSVTKDDDDDWDEV